MKQKNGKKSNKWLLPVLILVALAAVIGIVLAIVLPGNGEQPGSQASSDGRPVLYWNYEGESYIEAETGMSTRGKQEDGMYHISLLVDGEEKDMRCADKQLINYMDTMKVLMLTLDENGDIINAVNAEEAVTKIADGFYVQKVDGSTATFNTSFAINGMELPLELGELCKIYNMDPSTDPLGKIDSLGIMDQVSIYGLDETTPTHIFIVERAPESGVYFREKRMYDTTTGQTTREPDENGVYTIRFAHKGQLVDLKCRDKTIVNAIDSKAPLIGENALVFDSEGYIVDTVNVALALRGKLLATDYHAVEVNGKTVTIEKITIREYCEHCQKKVTWEAAPKSGLATIDSGKHLHYVLGEDVDVEWGYGVLSKGTTLCLNKYGSNIKHATRIFVAGGSKLNLMGKGTITATGIHKNDSLKTGNLTVTDGEINVYSGVTVKSANKNIPAIFVNGKNAVVNLHGGKIVGGATISQGLLNLDGKIDVKGIYIGAKGRLNVKETWTGEATMQAAVFTLEGISKTYGTSEGAFTGILTVGDVKLIGKDGA